MYDAIVVGARCAGSPTAMLLARNGYRVLLLDRGRFPSDIISTHAIGAAGVTRLHKWGLLDAVRDSNCPAIHTTTFWIGRQEFTPPPPADAEIPDVYSPRRKVLDQILVNAAIQAGAEFREQFVVDHLMFEDDRVVGIRGHGPAGNQVEERGRIVVGADGRHSLVATKVGADDYRTDPSMTCVYYGYFSGVGAEDVNVYVRRSAAVFVWPTNDELSIVGFIHPIQDFREVRTDIEGTFFRDLDRVVPQLAERVRAGHQEERFVGTADVPNYLRRAHGPGWVLAGDAGYCKDPVTALGITDAFRAAEDVATAIDDGFSGRRTLEDALEEYETRRNRSAQPLYDFTIRLASFADAGAVDGWVSGVARS